MPPIEINSSTKLFALIGTPVRHSYSPFIHNTAFEQLNLSACYVALNVSAGQLGEAVHGMRALGFGGFNVTVPHKESVMAHMDEISEEAQLIGSVNTAVNVKGKWVGYNTDAIGFARSVEKDRHKLKNKKILIVGAGGGARAVTYALIKHFAATDIVISNRSKDHAAKLIRDFNARFPRARLTFTPLEAVRSEFGFVINATSAGLHSKESLLKKPFFSSEMVVYDLIYHPSETLFLKYAREAGAACANGLEMLLLQASAAFEIWTGKKMPEDIMRKKLSDHIRKIK